MQVTEVRIKLMEGSEDRLRAFCSITLDNCFVVRDLKIIDGTHGPFVAMPSRKLSGHCHRCNYKNHLRALYCNQCGAKLKVTVPSDAPQKLYADVAHPVNSECRELISAAVLSEFEHELARASQPGYRSRYDDDFDSISESDDEHFVAAARSEGRSPRSAEERSPADAAAEQIKRIDPPPDEADRRSGRSVPPPHPPQKNRPVSETGNTPGDREDRDPTDFGKGIFD